MVEEAEGRVDLGERERWWRAASHRERSLVLGEKRSEDSREIEGV